MGTENKGYEDQIKGVIRDDSGRSFIIFTRISTGPYQFVHVLAYRSGSGEVFIVQKATILGILKKRMELLLEDADAGAHIVLVKEMQEQEEGLLSKTFAVASTNYEMSGRDSLPEDWWGSLGTLAIAEWAGI